MAGVEVWGKRPLFSVEDSLAELARLAATAGLEVVGRTSQRLSKINPATYLGSGKVEEIRALRDELDFDVFVFDEELSPGQIQHLEERLEVNILDRTALILDIFAMHASTREGALQVELAQYAYRLPRLTRQWTHLSRQGVGGVGLRGPGETQLEVDRRDIRRRMAHLRAELEEVRKQRSLRRRRRRQGGLSVAAIVGYTNAGKSTLLNQLSGAEVLVQDQLFATLDPTTRKVALPGGKEMLFTDTVGFIQKLPPQLVAAFRATLEEVNEADLLLHVVDVSDDNLMRKVVAVEDVLADMEADDKPALLLLNKIDLVDPDSVLDKHGDQRFGVHSLALDELSRRYEAVLPISAEQGVGIDELLKTLEDLSQRNMVSMEVMLPYDAGDVLSMWHERGIIDEEDYTAEGVRVKGSVPDWVAAIVRRSVSA